jgi:hypothetical protein
VSVGLAIENKDLRNAVEVAMQDVTTLIVFNQSDLSDLGALLMNVDRARPEALLLDLTSLRRWEDSLRAIKNLPSPPQIIAVHSSPDGRTILDAIRAQRADLDRRPLSIYSTILPSAAESGMWAIVSISCSAKARVTRKN